MRASVQVGLPVPGHAPGRAGYRLLSWMMLGWGECRAGAVHPVLGVAPEPALARLEAADQRVPRRGRVRAGVLRWRGVTAADVAAQRAAAQVEPPSVAGVAFDAAGPARRNGRVDVLLCGHPLVSLASFFVQARPSRISAAPRTTQRSGSST